MHTVVHVILCVCVHQQYVYGETKDISRPVSKPDTRGPNAFHSDSIEHRASLEMGDRTKGMRFKVS